MPRPPRVAHQRSSFVPTRLQYLALARPFTLSRQRYLTFLDSVTRVCAPSCPEGVSLSAPSTYGGGSYPTSDTSATVPTFTYVYRTQEVFSRCFPVSTEWTGASSELCITPQCTDSALEPLKASLSGSLTCAVLDDRPDETTTWEVCPSGASAADCALRAAACTYKVKQSTTTNYLPEDPNPNPRPNPNPNHDPSPSPNPGQAEHDDQLPARGLQVGQQRGDDPARGPGEDGRR